MPNEIRADMLKVKRMISDVEIVIGKRDGETELVNKLIDAENLLTYCMSRLENAVVPPCKVGDTVWILTKKCKYAGDKDEPWNACKHYWDNVYDHKMWGCAGKDKNGEQFWCKERKMELYIRPLVWELILLANENLVLGKNLFLNQKEAEQALKEGVDNAE